MNIAKRVESIGKKLIGEDGRGSASGNGNSGYRLHFSDGTTMDVHTVGGIGRGGATMFYVDDGGGLWYEGEDPGCASDGMDINDPWCSAEELPRYQSREKIPLNTAAVNAAPDLGWSEAGGAWGDGRRA